MPPLVALAALAALLVLATALGLLLQRRGASVREEQRDARLLPSELGIDGFDAQGTVVQFSTEFCARCPSVRRTLAELVAERDSLEFVHVDVTDRPELAQKYRLLQTPTVLLLDADGAPKTRLSGQLTRALLSDALNDFEGALR